MLQLELIVTIVANGHGKGRLSLKNRVRSQPAKRVELRVIVCAEYSYDRIRSRQCMAVELEDLEEVEMQPLPKVLWIH